MGQARFSSHRSGHFTCESESWWHGGDECLTVEDSAAIEGAPCAPDLEVTEVINDVLRCRWEEIARIKAIETELTMLKERCLLLETSGPAIAPIETLAPEPYVLTKPIPAVVRREGEEYTASFFDANLGASGQTQIEAVFNLKDVVVAAFELLGGMDDACLGPGPLQQKKVLEEYIRARK